MRPISQAHLLLLAAAYLHMPARRLRALARGEDPSLEEWLGGESARKVAHARHQAREAAARLARIGAAILTIADAAYPAGLHDLEDPPALLFVRGTLPESGIAVVGSRTPPPEAAAFAREFARLCAMPVVSGLASGIDAAAHHGALDARLPTLAYVGTGLGVTYPPEHLALEEEIVARGGAVASERLPDEAVTKWALVHRDRLQAAHARATVLVASEPDGGAMQTMAFAKVLGRPRFVLKAGSAPGYGGNALAQREGAVALPPDPQTAIETIAAALKKETARANVRRARAAR